MRKILFVLLSLALLSAAAFAQGDSPNYLDKLQGTWSCSQAGAGGPYVIKGKKITMPETVSLMEVTEYRIKKITGTELKLARKVYNATLFKKITWTYYFEGDDLYLNGIGPYKKRG